MLDTHTQFIYLQMYKNGSIEEWHIILFPHSHGCFMGVFQTQSSGEPIPLAAVVFGPKEDMDSSWGSQVQRENSISLSVARFRTIKLPRY